MSASPYIYHLELAAQYINDDIQSIKNRQNRLPYRYLDALEIMIYFYYMHGYSPIIRAYIGDIIGIYKTLDKIGMYNQTFYLPPIENYICSYKQLMNKKYIPFVRRALTHNIIRSDVADTLFCRLA